METPQEIWESFAENAIKKTDVKGLRQGRLLFFSGMYAALGRVNEICKITNEKESKKQFDAFNAGLVEFRKEFVANNERQHDGRPK